MQRSPMRDTTAPWEPSFTFALPTLLSYAKGTAASPPLLLNQFDPAVFRTPLFGRIRRDGRQGTRALGQLSLRRPKRPKVRSLYETG